MFKINVFEDMYSVQSYRVSRKSRFRRCIFSYRLIVKFSSGPCPDGTLLALLDQSNLRIVWITIAAPRVLRFQVDISPVPNFM